MAANTEFLADDRCKLDAMLEIYSRQAGSCLTLECLLGRWTTLVDQLGGRRRASRDEYEAQLRVRGLLDELVECLSEPGRLVLLRALAEPDRRFLALTVAGSGAATRFWWQRVPPAMSGGGTNQELREGNLR